MEKEKMKKKKKNKKKKRIKRKNSVVVEGYIIQDGKHVLLPKGLEAAESEPRPELPW